MRIPEASSLEPGMKKVSGFGRAVRFAPAAAIFLAMGVGHDPGTPSAATAAAPRLPAPPANGELGFVVTQFHVPFHKGDLKTDCPDGMMGVLKDNYLATLPAAERARLEKPENGNELDRLWKAYGLGPDNANLCGNVYEFLDRPPTAMNVGKVAVGLNLDNDDNGEGKDSYTCKHVNYASPTGEKGIDHQFWRVQGCGLNYRGVADDGDSEYRLASDTVMMSGENTQVFLLRGVNSLVNDPSVEVIYANTVDRPIADGGGRPIHNASFTVSTLGRRAEYRNVLHGRIVNGVLTTDSKDIMLHRPYRGFHDLARARIRLEFQPDGSVKGLMGGYEVLLDNLAAMRGGGRGSVQTAGINCAGQYNALRLMADGDKDPKTGQCRRISFAWELVGVPAFVTDAPLPRKTAKK